MRYMRFVLPLLALAAVLFAHGDTAAAPGDAIADRVFGQGGSFMTSDCPVPPTVASLCLPRWVAVDGAGNAYVSDTENQRVLEYNTPLAPGGDMVADRVFGQGGSFTSSAINLGGVSASSLHNPQGVAVDSNGNLYVADSSNNRVLEYDTPLAPGANSVADRVFGQIDFTGTTCNQGGFFPSAGTLCGPVGVAVDGAGNVYVTDFDNSRVLEYNTPLAPGGDTVADLVVGQDNFATDTFCAHDLCTPWGAAVDGAGNLYVSDYGCARSWVVEYDSPMTSNTVADRFFGPGVSDPCAIPPCPFADASSLCSPAGVAVDGGGNLFVADQLSHRVLQYDTPTVPGGNTVADRVFGQGGSFTSNTCNLGAISAASLCNPYGVAVDGSGNLYVADYTNSRVLEYDNPLAPPPPAADTDGDGIVDPIDTLPAAFSDAFSDVPGGGTTFGEILSRGGLTVAVTELTNPAGVNIAAGGAGSSAVVQVCSAPPTILTLTSGDSVSTDPPCGSAGVTVSAGPVDVKFATIGGTLPTGARMMVSEIPPVRRGGAISYSVVNSGGVAITIGGLTVAAGETVVVQDLDGDGLVNQADSDDDGDNVSDVAETNCGADPLAWGRLPERVDAPFAGVDDDGDTLIDEVLPTGAGAYDCDGDGYIGSVEDHVYQYIPQTTGDQKTCAEYESPGALLGRAPSRRWPADLVSGGFPDSTERITLTDVLSFIAPSPKILGANPGDAAYHVRWDLVPGPGPYAAHINIGDLLSLVVLAPPMFGGSRAFASPAPECPW